MCMRAQREPLELALMWSCTKRSTSPSQVTSGRIGTRQSLAPPNIDDRRPRHKDRCSLSAALSLSQLPYLSLSCHISLSAALSLSQLLYLSLSCSISLSAALSLSAAFSLSLSCSISLQQHCALGGGVLTDC